jgi:hypothetical protein
LDETTPRGVVVRDGPAETRAQENAMRTILIAHRDVAFSDQLAAELRQTGYHVIDCGGPWPPVERCIRCDKGYCPLTEAADLMIYDPLLTALDAQGQRYSLAVDSARAHPEVPMLLAWGPNEVPDAGTLRAIRADAPHSHVAASTRDARLKQVHDLLSASITLEVIR